MEKLQKIIDLIQSFLEKYFIISLVSVLITIVAKYFTPDNFQPLEKLGNETYFIGIFLLSFLIIVFLKYIVVKALNNIKDSKYKTKLNEEQNQQNIKTLKKYVDSLKPNERKLLDYFMDNNNKPIIYFDLGYDFYRLEMIMDQSEFIVEDSNTKITNPFTFEIKNVNKGAYANKYKIKKEIFDDLKYMKESKIGISNF